MKLEKQLTVAQYKTLRNKALNNNETRVVVHTFKPGELKMIQCYGVYVENVWIDTYDSFYDLKADFPQAILLT